MFLTLAAGAALWLVYGFFDSDVVITANFVSFALLMASFTSSSASTVRARK
jgi:hypothetical protein